MIDGVASLSVDRMSLRRPVWTGLPDHIAAFGRILYSGPEMEHVGHDAMERGRGGSAFGRVSPNRLRVVVMVRNGAGSRGFSIPWQQVLLSAGAHWSGSQLWLSVCQSRVHRAPSSRSNSATSNQVNSVAFSSDGR